MNTTSGRGGVTLYSDWGNLLNIAWRSGGTPESVGGSQFRPAVVLDDTETANDDVAPLGIKARVAAYASTKMLNYAKITGYGNDYSIPLFYCGPAMSNSAYLCGSLQLDKPVYIGGYYGATLQPYMSVNSGGITVYGNIACTGAKLRSVVTENYGTIGQNAYETTEAYFGDIGRCKLDDNGICYIYFDDKFKSTVNTSFQYEVAILDTYGNLEMDLEELQQLTAHCVVMEQDFFAIKGTPNITVAWEVKVKQKGYELDRLEAVKLKLDNDVSSDSVDDTIEPETPDTPPLPTNPDNQTSDIFDDDIFGGLDFPLDDMLFE
jgi:hypothetical protein